MGCQPTNRHVEGLELLEEEVEGPLLFEGLVIPPLHQHHLGHHQLQQDIQENPKLVNSTRYKVHR